MRSRSRAHGFLALIPRGGGIVLRTMITRKGWLLGVSLVWMMGCDGGSKPAADLASGGDLAVTVPDLSIGDDQFELDEQLVDASNGDGGQVAIAGASACLFGIANSNVPCATSSAAGLITFAFPKGLLLSESPLSISFTANGYLGRTQLFKTTNTSANGESFSPLTMLSNADAQALFAAAGVTFPQAGSGYVVGSVSSAGFQISPSQGVVTYLDSTGNGVPNTTMTVDGGGFIVSGFTQGLTVLTIQHGSAMVSCTHMNVEGNDFDVPEMDTPNQITLPVAPDTAIFDQKFLCTAQ